MRTPSSEPEWIDVSPDVSPQDESAQSAQDDGAARWIRGWGRFKYVLLLAAAIGVTRWITWRQSVMYEPPIQVSAALPSATPASTSASTSGARRAAFNAASTSTTSAPTPRAQKMVVHIVGLVKRPGVIEMGAGARLKDAIFQAGGTLPNADLETINLAEPLEDGRQYRVTAKNQAPQVLAPAPRPRPKTTRTSIEKKPNLKSAKAPRAPVDLNRADASALQELPGVGPSTAQKIIEFRDEIGGFKSVDDLDGVKGIGPKKLDKIRPFAVVR